MKNLATKVLPIVTDTIMGSSFVPFLDASWSASVDDVVVVAISTCDGTCPISGKLNYKHFCSKNKIPGSFDIVLTAAVVWVTEHSVSSCCHPRFEYPNSVLISLNNSLLVTGSDNLWTKIWDCDLIWSYGRLRYLVMHIQRRITTYMCSEPFTWDMNKCAMTRVLI